MVLLVPPGSRGDVKCSSFRADCVGWLRQLSAAGWMSRKYGWMKGRSLDVLDGGGWVNNG